MVITALVNKLSRASACAAISMAISATVGCLGMAPVSAAQFTFSGRFANQAVSGSTGLAVQLQGGSFEGTYEVDGLPAGNITTVNLKSWQVYLRNPLGNVLKTYSSNAPNLGAAVFGQYDNTNTDVLLFADVNSQFQLNFTKGFVGKGTVLLEAVNPTGTVYPSAAFIYEASRNAPPTGIIHVASGESKSVPEPSTAAGLGVVGVIGWLCKRNYKTA